MRRRNARAVAELAADLQQRLGRLGVPYVAAADHVAEKATRQQATARNFTARRLDVVAAGLAEARTPVDASALAEWTAFKLEPITAVGSLS
jgi:hypothetical protein